MADGGALVPAQPVACDYCDEAGGTIEPAVDDTCRAWRVHPACQAEHRAKLAAAQP